jgi:hypothetical protein
MKVKAGSIFWRGTRGIYEWVLQLRIAKLGAKHAAVLDTDRKLDHLLALTSSAGSSARSTSTSSAGQLPISQFLLAKIEELVRKCFQMHLRGEYGTALPLAQDAVTLSRQINNSDALIVPAPVAIMVAHPSRTKSHRFTRSSPRLRMPRYRRVSQ